ALALVFIGYGGRALLGSLGSYCIFHASQYFRLRLRRTLLTHMFRLSADYHESISVGAKSYLVQDLTEELGQISADLFPILLRMVVLGAAVVSAMIMLDRRLSSIVVPLAPLFYVVVKHLRKRLRSSTEAVQIEFSSTNGLLQEQLSMTVQLQLLRQ